MKLKVKTPHGTRSYVHFRGKVYMPAEAAAVKEVDAARRLAGVADAVYRAKSSMPRTEVAANAERRRAERELFQARAENARGMALSASASRPPADETPTQLVDRLVRGIGQLKRIADQTRNVLLRDVERRRSEWANRKLRK
jgi:type I site-specific restriction endonuclease